MRHSLSILLLIGALAAPAAVAQERSQLDRVLDAIVERENALVAKLADHEPLVETYYQTVREDAELGSVPLRDNYFLGRLNFTEAPPPEASMREKRKASKEKMLDLYDDFYSDRMSPDGFARMLILDAEAFDRKHYKFEFLRREFLGEIRTLVFDIRPTEVDVPAGPRGGRFSGRIWVDDEQFNIVRYNGIYASHWANSLHFDSWRLEMEPGSWLPAYIYTEDSARSSTRDQIKHKGQTRIWGYEITGMTADDAFAKVMIDSDLADDESETPGQVSPVESLRAWEREAEDNVLRRLERAGLLAPSGEVNEVLETVIANLEISNDLVIEPPVRARVLMTTPLESFTIGHTIVLSRGMVDVLPDEASLAMVLAHELGHVLSGHQLDTKYAFSDQMLVGDKQAMTQFVFRRDPLEEREADERAVELLENSPYSDKLEGAGLFLKALSAHAKALPALIRPHFGNQMASKNELYRMPAVMDAAPELDPKSIEQTAALPLGGRVKVDPWSARIELMKNNRVALLSAREKLPFQVTPLMPHLTRMTDTTGRAAAPSERDIADDPTPTETDTGAAGGAETDASDTDAAPTGA